MNANLAANRKQVYNAQRNPCWQDAIKGFYRDVAHAQKCIDQMYANKGMGYAMGKHDFGTSFSNSIYAKSTLARKAQENSIIDDYIKNHVLKNFKDVFAKAEKKVGPSGERAIAEFILYKLTKNSLQVNALVTPQLRKFFTKMSIPLDADEWRFARDTTKKDLVTMKETFSKDGDLPTIIQTLKEYNIDFVNKCNETIKNEQIKATIRALIVHFPEPSPFLVALRAFCENMSPDKVEDLIHTIMQNPENSVQTLIRLRELNLIQGELKTLIEGFAVLLTSNINCRAKWLSSRMNCEVKLREIRKDANLLRPQINWFHLTAQLVNAFRALAGLDLLPDHSPANPAPANIEPVPDQPPAVEPKASPQDAPQNVLPPPPSEPPPLPPGNQVPKDEQHLKDGKLNAEQPNEGEAKDVQPRESQIKERPKVPLPPPPANREKKPSAIENVVLRKVPPPPQHNALKAGIPELDARILDYLKNLINQQGAQENKILTQPPQADAKAKPDQVDANQPAHHPKKKTKKKNAVQAAKEEVQPAEPKKIVEKKPSFLRFIFRPYIWLWDITKLLCSRLFKSQTKGISPSRR